MATYKMTVDVTVEASSLAEAEMHIVNTMLKGGGGYHEDGKPRYHSPEHGPKCFMVTSGYREFVVGDDTQR